jgi:hypothetical protein
MAAAPCAGTNISIQTWDIPKTDGAVKSGVYSQMEHIDKRGKTT